MLQYILLYLALIPVFFLIDFLWLGTLAQKFYQDQIGHLLASPFNIPAAVAFYLIFIVGIIIFAVMPGLQAGDWKTSLMWGALFGFFTYATYDLTNLATLRDWPLTVVVVDVVWGTFLCASVATAGYFIGTKLLNF
jgi:uncharacterized membrane protein